VYLSLSTLLTRWMAFGYSPSSEALHASASGSPASLGFFAAGAPVLAPEPEAGGSTFTSSASPAATSSSASPASAMSRSTVRSTTSTLELSISRRAFQLGKSIRVPWPQSRTVSVARNRATCLPL